MRRIAPYVLLAVLSFNVQADFYEGLKAYKRGDYHSALKSWRSLAIQGNAAAQYDLGLVYLSGEGFDESFETDPIKAAYWLRKAANQKLPRAQAMLGTLYEQGLGIAKNYLTAASLYHQAAQEGDPLGQYRLGMLYKTGRGVSRDASQAVLWLRHAAERGLAPAQQNLGVMYYNGIGVPRRFKEALKWHTKAAEQGNLSAIITLGLMYFKGEGVSKNYKEAYSWWSAAVSAGDSQSIKARDAVAAMLSSNELADAQQMAEAKRVRIFRALKRG